MRCRRDSSGAGASRVADLMVIAEDVVKSFGKHDVLKGISMTVEAGSVMSLLGPSGSGKSTFLRCINHLESIDGGSLLVDGELVGYRDTGRHLVELSERETAHRRKSTGMVFQRFNLFPHMTAEANVAVGPRHVLGQSKSAARQSALELLERVGLGGRGDAYPSQLSGGQQQRVAIARALALRPKLLLFDEPTSSLDPELVTEVLDVIGQLAETGMTMVIVTHEMGFARDVSDNVTFIDDGLVVEAGPPDQMFTNPQQERTQKFLSRSSTNDYLRSSHDDRE